MKHTIEGFNETWHKQSRCELALLIRFSRSRGQRSRSRSDGHRNHVNSTAREPLKGSEPKLMQTLTVLGRRNDYVFKMIGSEVKVTETYAGGGITTNGSPSKTSLFILLLCALA